MDFIKTQSYIRALKRLEISEEDETKLYTELAELPKKGDVIRGGGGIRKIRMSLRNRGKSAGARVIYFYLEVKGRIYLLTAYAKNERENLTKAETENLKKLATILREEAEK